MKLSEASKDSKAKTNQLNSLAIVAEDLSALAGLIETLEEQAIETLDIYSKQVVELETSFALRFLPYANARETLLESFKDLLKTGDEISGETIFEAIGENPDLIIKIGKRKSLENSMVCGASYAEIFFAEELNIETLNLAIEDFNQRKRNFGS